MPAISCQEIKTLLQQGGQLVDVRSPLEFSRGALQGAINIPMQSIYSAANLLDLQKPVMVYCHSGIRSANAKTWLLSMGFQVVVDLSSPYHIVDCIELIEQHYRQAGRNP